VPLRSSRLLSSVFTASMPCRATMARGLRVVAISGASVVPVAVGVAPSLHHQCATLGAAPDTSGTGEDRLGMLGRRCAEHGAMKGPPARGRGEVTREADAREPAALQDGVGVIG
jgi:hypothetical protein